MHCEAECSSLKGSWMLFQAEQTCDGTYVHVWTRTYTDACSPAADSNSDLVSSDYINTALWVVRYLMTIYHKKYVKGKNTTKQTNKTKTCPTSSDWWLLVCNFVLVCCGVDTCAQSVVNCLETMCRTLECSLDKAGSTQPEISFTAMSTCERCFYFSSSQ